MGQKKKDGDSQGDWEEFRDGWPCLVYCFIVQIFTVGLSFSLGGLYVSWLKDFNDSRSLTSWVVSIMVAIMLGIGPVPSALMQKFGNRVVQVSGAVMACSGFALSYFVTSVPQLIITLGVLGGSGLGFVYLPSIILPSQYFVKRRALAYGIATSGVGIGAFLLPPLITWLEGRYGWRGALLITSGILLNMVVIGLLSKENTAVMTSPDDPEDDGLDPVDLDITIEVEEVPLVKPGQILVNDDNTLDDNQNGYDVYNSKHSINTNTTDYDNIKRYVDGIHNPERHINGSPFNKFLDVDRTSGGHRSGSYQHIANRSPNSRQFSSAAELCLKRGLTTSGVINQEDTNSGKGSFRNLDIAFCGSIYSLRIMDDNYGSKKSIDYNRLLHKPSANVEDVEEGPPPDVQIKSVQQHKGGNVLTRWLGYLVDHFSLLKDRTFLCLFMSSLLTNLSYLMPVLYMVDRAVEGGVDNQSATMLMSVNGVGNILGRFLFGLMADCPCLDSVVLYISTLTICGIGTSLSPLCGGDFTLHCMYVAFFGFFMGGYVSLAPVTCVDLMGVSRVGQAYGILLLSQGMAGALGPPLAGWVIEWTGDFDWAYILHGLWIVFSAAVLIPITVLRICCNKS